MPEVKYRLSVSVDDEEVYDSEFFSEESLEEEGLRKAQHAIDERMMEFEEAEYERT